MRRVGEALRRVAALGAVGLIVAGAASAARLGEGDFGDAPDGRPTGYFGGATLGAFPSLHARDGAHAHDTGVVRFGASASNEPDARLVDADTSDDGVAVTLRPCATSTAYVSVSAAPGATGTAYVNLLFDWNRNGLWSGQDRCASEWPVRNVAIDLAQHGAGTRVYAIPFRGGVQTRNLWYRALISHEQRWTTEAGTGAIARGEVEDSKVGNPVSRNARRKGRPVLLSAMCAPSPLVVARRSSGRILLDRRPGARSIDSISLAPGVVAKNAVRTLSVRGTVLTYRSTGGPARTVEEIVRVRVSYDKIGSIVVPCRVRVVQPPITRAEPTRANCTLTGPQSEYTILGGTAIRGRLRLGGSARSWARQCGGPDDAAVGGVEISGFAGAAPIGAVLHLGDPTRRTPPPTWGCTPAAPGVMRCAGTPLRVGTNYYFDVSFGGAVPEGLGQVHVVLLSTNGETLGSVESARAAA
jgi:hypothetical protein